MGVKHSSFILYYNKHFLSPYFSVSYQNFYRIFEKPWLQADPVWWFGICFGQSLAGSWFPCNEFGHISLENFGIRVRQVRIWIQSICLYILILRVGIPRGILPLLLFPKKLFVLGSTRKRNQLKEIRKFPIFFLSSKFSWVSLTNSLSRKHLLRAIRNLTTNFSADSPGWRQPWWPLRPVKLGKSCSNCCQFCTVGVNSCTNATPRIPKEPHTIIYISTLHRKWSDMLYGGLFLSARKSGELSQIRVPGEIGKLYLSILGYGFL